MYDAHHLFILSTPQVTTLPTLNSTLETLAAPLTPHPSPLLLVLSPSILHPQLQRALQLGRAGLQLEASGAQAQLQEALPEHHLTAMQRQETQKEVENLEPRRVLFSP